MSFFDWNKNKKLLEAFGEGDTATVKELLDKGANPNIKTGGGLPLLIIAAKKHDVVMLKMLLDKGADVNAKDESGWTALIWTAMMGYTNIGMEVEGFEEERSQTAIFLRQMNRSPLINTMNVQHQIIQALLDKGIDINARGKDGKTALIIAAIKGDSTIVEMLLDRGVRLNERDDDGNTALILAVANGHLQIVRLLLNKGADVNAADVNGETALRVAEKKGNADILALMNKTCSRILGGTL